MIEVPRQAERVLFLPGASGERDFWKPVADRIRHSGEKMLLGWPGFGANPPDPSIESLDDLFASVLRRIDRPVDDQRRDRVLSRRRQRGPRGKDPSASLSYSDPAVTGWHWFLREKADS